MITDQTMVFRGFSPQAPDFLKGLRANNNKAWFEAHRIEYDEYLLAPFKALVTELGMFMLTIDSRFEIRPAVSKTISRIYRDTRFSKDKSPYRNNMWFSFKRPIKDWQDSPVFFFELTPDSYSYGMGFYQATKSTMDKFRKAIDAKPKEFLKAINFYTEDQPFVVEGDKYKRILDPGKPAEIQEWYQHKSFYVLAEQTIDSRLFTRELVNDIINGFSLLTPLYHYFWKIGA